MATGAMDSTSRSAIYHPLPLDTQAKQIRILTLHSGRFTDQLRGTLRVIGLESHQRYEALSYTWGQSTLHPSPKITLNDDHSLPITDNLYAALRRLRHRFRNRELWIDALCINQADTEEQNSQVRMMGLIYRSAFRVCIWLGDTPDVAPLYHHIALRLAPEHALTVRFTGSQWGPLRAMTPSVRGLYRVATRAIINTQPMWHTRAWVYQEVVNADRVLWCFGPYARECNLRKWSKFLSIYSTLEIDPMDKPATPEGRIAVDLAELLHGAYNNARVHLGGTLLDNARATAGMQAKDARDKVFSLKGVTYDAEAEHLTVDYARTPAEVYAQATFASIVGAQSWSALLYACGASAKFSAGAGTKDAACLPTWSIDWKRGIPGDWWQDPMAILQRAKSLSPSRPRLCPCSLHLHLQVRVLDKVQASLPMPEQPTKQEVFEELAREHKSLYALSSSVSRTQTSRAERPARDEGMASMQSAERTLELPHETTTVDTVAQNTERRPEATLRWFDEIHVILAEDDRGIFYVDVDESRLPSLNGDVHTLTAVRRYLYRCCGLGENGTLNAAFFTTTSGFLGAGHPGVAADDVLAPLDDTHVHIVLRPKGDMYQYVGMAYIGSPVVGDLEAFSENSETTLEEVALM